MSQYTTAELKLLSRLVAAEGVTRDAELSLHEQHKAAKEHAAKTGKPVQGVCPTMFRNLNPGMMWTDDINCQSLVTRLKKQADEVSRKG